MHTVVVEVYFSIVCLLSTGVLVEAMRNGYWVILDELNLAPTDVLEALNRVRGEGGSVCICSFICCIAGTG